MSWWSFLSAHVPALRLAAAVGIIDWTLATVLRHWDLPPAVRLILIGGVTLLAVLLLIHRLPRLFLGRDGLWMVELLGGYLPKRFRLSVSGSAAGGTATGETATP
jgi:hypothetical protein